MDYYFSILRSTTAWRRRQASLGPHPLLAVSEARCFASAAVAVCWGIARVRLTWQAIRVGDGCTSFHAKADWCALRMKLVVVWASSRGPDAAPPF
jgi:hypothetical protein